MRAGYVLALLALSPFLVWNGFVQQLDGTLHDHLLRIRGASDSPNVRRIALLAIDDHTAARYGPLPLNRARIAEALDRIARGGPAVLAMDLLLSERTTPEADAALAAALAKFPRVVLSAAIASDGVPTWIEPLDELARNARVGHVHASPDADGIVRSISLVKEAETRRHWALGFETARMALGTNAPLETADLVELGGIRIPAREPGGRPMAVNYAGPDGTFDHLSLAAVLEGKIPPEVFRGRIVILGATAQGSGDRLFTPVSSGIGMNGVEIHANVARTILDRAFLLPVDVPRELLIYAAIAAAAVLAVVKLRGARLVLALAALAVALPAAAFAALQAGRVVPLGGMLAVFAFSAAAGGAGEYAAVEMALRRSERRRKEYASRVQAIAHEIKTPLTAIQGSSELISSDILPESQRAEIAGLIYKESKRLTGIIHAFLDLERMASGAMQLEKRPLALKPLCEDVLERARLYAARKGSRIESDVQPIDMQADAELLSFAIYNLLTNAVKYSPRDSAIRLAATERDGSVAIAISDTGRGIAPAEQERIFEKFYRARGRGSAGEEGTGIGLALVKEITVQHGGRVLVESEPGAGSRFTLLLPKG